MRKTERKGLLCSRKGDGTGFTQCLRLRERRGRYQERNAGTGGGAGGLGAEQAHGLKTQIRAAQVDTVKQKG